MGKNERYGGLEWFRVLSAVLVIAIHTSPLLCFGEFPDQSDCPDRSSVFPDDDRIFFTAGHPMEYG